MDDTNVVPELPDNVQDGCREKLLEIGQLIAAARNKAGYSQTVLGDLSGGCRTYISNIERGVANFTFVYLYDVIQALGLELEDVCCSTRVVVKYPDPGHSRIHAKVQEYLEQVPDPKVLEELVESLLMRVSRG